MRRITDLPINTISVKKLAGPIVMKMAVIFPPTTIVSGIYRHDNAANEEFV
jgi:hypothetical protein